LFEPTILEFTVAESVNVPFNAKVLSTTKLVACDEVAA
jgi:hypothetical protein